MRVLILFLCLIVFTACGSESEAELVSVFSVEMLISNGNEEIVLEFGQNANPSDVNEQVPPPPPESFLHAYIEQNNQQWWANYLTENNIESVWVLHIQPGGASSVSLTWSVDAREMEGDLTFTDTQSGAEVDMLHENSLDINTDSDGSFIIRYLLEP